MSRHGISKEIGRSVRALQWPLKNSSRTARADGHVTGKVEYPSTEGYD